MKAGGILLGGVVPFALLGDRMQEDGFVQILDIVQNADQFAQIVPVDGADVFETAALEKVVLIEPALDAVLDFAQIPAERARFFKVLLKRN